MFLRSFESDFYFFVFAARRSWTISYFELQFSFLALLHYYVACTDVPLKRKILFCCGPLNNIIYSLHRRYTPIYGICKGSFCLLFRPFRSPFSISSTTIINMGKIRCSHLYSNRHWMQIPQEEAFRHNRAQRFHTLHEREIETLIRLRPGGGGPAYDI